MKTNSIVALCLAAGCGAGLHPIDRSRPAKSGELTLRTSFSPDPARLEGQAVGVRDVSSYEPTDTGPCAGWVGENPDHYLKLEDRFETLRIEVDAQDDTTLVVEGPDGRFCSDDQQEGNRNPRIQGFFREGDYAIWIGTRERGGTADYRIYFSQSEAN